MPTPLPPPDQSNLLATMAFQARTLQIKLSAITVPTYPKESQSIAQLLAAFALYIGNELDELSSHVREAASSLHLLRGRKLLGGIQRLYSYVRYFEASQTTKTPPAAQQAFTAMAERWFREFLREHVVVVRPQWKYNLTYVPFSNLLLAEVRDEILDPDGKLTWHGSEPRERAEAFLDQIWETLGPAASQRPRDVAVVSFAGLDTDDVFQLPLLAHELGHFVDLSRSTPLSRDPRIVEHTFVPLSAVEEQVVSLGLEPQKIEEIWNETVSRIQVCIEEIIADIIAVRLLGFAFLASQREFLLKVSDWPQPHVTPTGYPGIAYRLHLVLRELEDIERQPNARSREFADLQAWMALTLDEWRAHTNEGLDLSHGALPAPPIEAVVRVLSSEAVERALPVVGILVDSVIPRRTPSRDLRAISERLERLNVEVPPSIEGDKIDDLNAILSAAWIHRLRERRERNSSVGLQTLYEADKKWSRLTWKAIELAVTSRADESVDRSSARSRRTRKPERPGVLAQADLLRRLSLPLSDPKTLVVMPLKAGSVQGSSIDVRVGHWFKIARRSRLPHIDLSETVALETSAYEEIYVPISQSLIIHPRELVLGVTLEYTLMPNDVMAFLEARSRPGRAGLLVATATQVAPGFKGCVVMELYNAGTVPLRIHPYVSIAQLVFVSTSSNAPPYTGHSHCQTRP